MRKNTFKLILVAMSALICLGLLFVSCDSGNKGDGGDSGDGEVVQSSVNSTQGTNDSTGIFGGETGTTGGTTDTSGGTANTNGSTTDTSSGTANTNGGTTDTSGGGTVGTTAGTNIGTVDSSIEGCRHRGGTATCQERAICRLCNQPYGDLGDHSYSLIDRKDSTCVENGYELYECTLCGEGKTVNIASVGTHTFEYTETEPTCVAPGTSKGVCSVCGYETEMTETKPALGHDGTGFVTVVVKEPTCTETGLQKLICEVCQEEQWQKGFKSEIPALGHSYLRGGILLTAEAGVTCVSARCGVDGYFERVCTDCGYDKEPLTREDYKALEDILGANYSEALYESMVGFEHDFCVFVGTIEPTCTEYGYNVYGCNYCDTMEHYISAIPSGHSYYMNSDAQEDVHFTVISAPTCVTEGKRAYICTACGEVATDSFYIRAIPVLPHDTSNRDSEYYVTTVEGTCSESAYEVYKCCNGDCGITEYIYFGEPLGHDWERNGVPSCATAGYTPYRCSRCPEMAFIQDEYSIPDVKHTIGAMVAEPTCISDAVYCCSVCAAEYPPYYDDPQYYDGLAHGMHRLVCFEDVEPTCSSVGYKLYRCIADENCTLMGKNDDAFNLDTPKAEDIVMMTDHTFVLDEYNNAMLAADGTVCCIVCGTVYRDVFTKIEIVESKLCRGTCPSIEECTCDIVVETISYACPEAIQLYPNQQISLDNLGNIAGGLIILEGYEGVYYQVTLCDSDYNQVMNYFVEGDYCYINLYGYEEISHVTVYASSYATVRLMVIA